MEKEGVRETANKVPLLNLYSGHGVVAGAMDGHACRFTVAVHGWTGYHQSFTDIIRVPDILTMSYIRRTGRTALIFLISNKN